MVQKSFQLDAVARRIKSAHLRPRQKYRIPVSSNQEYGWEGENGGYTKKTAAHHKPINSTAITQYVENYQLTRGKNPFKQKGELR